MMLLAGGGYLASTALLLLCGAPLAASNAASNQAEPVAWVIFVDDLHLNFRDTGRVKLLVETILDNLVQDGDLAAILTSGPSGVITGLNDRQALRPLVRKLTGNGPRPTEVLSVATPTELAARAKATLTRATAAVALLAKSEPRRRALLYISNGHSSGSDDPVDRRELINLAGASDVRIFTFGGGTIDRPSTPLSSDPRWQGYEIAAGSELQTMAEHGGGFAVVDKQVRPALARISDLMRLGDRPR
jgi:hypothetical protein